MPKDNQPCIPKNNVVERRRDELQFSLRDRKCFASATSQVVKRSVALRPNRIQQRRQTITTPRHAFARGSRCLAVVRGGWSRVIRDAFMGHLLCQLEAFVGPALKIRRVAQIQSRIAGRISSPRQGGCRRNLVQRRWTKVSTSFLETNRCLRPNSCEGSRS